MMRRIDTATRLAAAALVLAMAATACDDSPSEPTPDPIRITVTGVEDEARYTEAVTIDISTSRGTYTAELDGESFLSGTTVNEIGAHTLVVQARDGVDATSTTLDFELVFEGTSTLIVRMIDLGDNEAGGGGDAILLTDSADGGIMFHALVDAGPGINGDAGYVADRLQELGVTRLEAVILTHAHTDHFDGLPAVLRNVDVERFIYNGQVRSYSGYTSLITLAQSSADTVIVPGELLPLRLSNDGGTTLQVVPPLTSYLGNASAGSSELNEGSVGTAVTRGAFRMFMTGDGEREANGRWRRDYGALSGGVDVLKAGHHGANDAVFDAGSSGSSTWLEHTAPGITLISANGTTHPLSSALNRLINGTTGRTYCTHVHGDIELRVDPEGAVTTAVERNEAMDCVAASGH